MYLYAGGGVRQDLAIPLIARRVCWPSLSSHAVSVLAIPLIARRVCAGHLYHRTPCHHENVAINHQRTCPRFPRSACVSQHGPVPVR